MLTSLTNATFDAFLATKDTLVIIFSASWCAPCHPYRDIVNSVAKRCPKAKFAVVDIETEPELAEDFQIRSVPTTLILREHVALCKESGIIQTDILLDLIYQAMQLDMETVHQGIVQDIIHD